jgi:hypothetical protein
MSDRRHRDLKRTLTSLAAEHGGSVELTQTRGGHLRARFAVGGRSTDIIMAATPSDWRNGRNTKSLVRRVLRVATATS